MNLNIWVNFVVVLVCFDSSVAISEVMRKSPSRQSSKGFNDVGSIQAPAPESGHVQAPAPALDSGGQSQSDGSILPDPNLLPSGQSQGVDAKEANPHVNAGDGQESTTAGEDTAGEVAPPSVAGADETAMLSTTAAPRNDVGADETAMPSATVAPDMAAASTAIEASADEAAAKAMQETAVADEAAAVKVAEESPAEAIVEKSETRSEPRKSIRTLKAEAAREKAKLEAEARAKRKAAEKWADKAYQLHGFDSDYKKVMLAVAPEDEFRRIAALWKVCDRRQKKKEWSYESANTWRCAYEDCAKDAQSPVDIKTETIRTQQMATLEEKINYLKVANRNISHNGKAIVVDGDFGELFLHDGTYRAKQFLFHAPSEHSIDGKVAEAEMQIVHQRIGASGNDGLAIVSVLLDGAAQGGRNMDHFLSTLDFLNLPGEGQTKQFTQTVNIKRAIKDEIGAGYYYYKGSMTTPPCSETVHWLVLQSHPKISNNFLSSLQVLFGNTGNSRPVQELLGRKITTSLPDLPKSTTTEKMTQASGK